MNKIDSIKLIRTTSDNADFAQLIAALDEDLYQRNGEAQLKYRRFNKVDLIKHVVLVYVDGKPVGCGAFKKYDDESVEIKRMFVLPEMRGKQLAAQILQELENWAIDEGYCKAVLETGHKQTEAIRLYTVAGYSLTENYGQYIGMEESICYRKELK
jgi:GNAT superfamily N-acetyltransferase